MRGGLARAGRRFQAQLAAAGRTGRDLPGRRLDDDLIAAMRTTNTNAHSDTSPFEVRVDLGLPGQRTFPNLGGRQISQTLPNPPAPVKWTAGAKWNSS